MDDDKVHKFNNIMYCHTCKRNTETKFILKNMYVLNQSYIGLFRECSECDEQIELEYFVQKVTQFKK